MTRPVVADTGPLVALARVEQLDLLLRLYEWVIVPPAVHAELALDSDRPGARGLAGAFDAGWITVEAVTASAKELARLLGPGEAEVVTLAEQADARFLLMDDARGRRIARSRGIPVAGVAGVLLVAKSREEVATVGAILGARQTPVTVSPLASSPGCSPGLFIPCS